MAQLSDNGLYTIEYGSSAWRSILNTNVAKTITETKLNNGITTDINQTGNYNITGDIIQVGDINQTGNYNIIGDINQTGNYTVAKGNLVLNDNLAVNGKFSVAGCFFSNSDIYFPRENKGVVLKDRADGTRYRLYVNNGVCDVEAVPESPLSVVDIFCNNGGVALYTLDGNTDDAGGTHNASSTDITYSAGKFSDGAVFNGSSSSIYLGNVNLLNSSHYSISLWFSVNDLSSGSHNPLYYVNIPNSPALFITFTDGALGYLQYWGYSPTYTVIENNSNLSTDTWYHLAFVHTGSEIHAYLNGVRKVTQRKGIENYTGADNEQTLGAFRSTDGNNTEYWLDGALDQVRIFDRALTDDEVNTLYNES